MHIVHRGLDNGLPVRFVEHLYVYEGDTLKHFTDGQLRAEVELEHVHQFVADHPEAALALGEDAPEGLATKVAEFKLARAKEFTAIRQRVAAGADQSAIDKIIEKRVAEALKRYEAIMSEKLSAAVAAATAPKQEAAAG